MSESFADQPIDGAELTSRCCHRKPLRLQYQASQGDKTLYHCVDCGAEYWLKSPRAGNAGISQGPAPARRKA